MEGRSGTERIMMERGYTETRIVDSRCGLKMIIPVCSASVPACWADVVREASEIFMHVYTEVCGKPPESIYVDGNLMACLDRRVPAGRKLGLHIVIVAEGDAGTEPQDYMIDLPIRPGDGHFAEARQCFIDVFRVMLDGRREAA